MSIENNTESKVLSILDTIKKDQKNEENTTDNLMKSKPKTKGLKKKSESNEIRSIPKSGRFWKTKKERFNSIVKTKGIRLDFQKKTALRLELQRTKELSRQITQQIQEKEEARKQRRRENIKRAEENKRKSEVVQVITNTKKLKRMKKKQLRFIEKRDTNKEVSSNK
ncbi:coiled-coil domain-containing protein 86 [Zerene cesonia]|uniref:coiled-coil domain-containing protein 86 n=1 Tax=Zerene cesonia TaxID=33412 RepID=UPI0018E4FF53|nr:coiled-coil domain-containing protein 86 [Zerene cesonia]